MGVHVVGGEVRRGIDENLVDGIDQNSQVVPLIQKGPMEGMVIVDGRPQMESCDMPTISFSEAELKRLAEYYQGK